LNLIILFSTQALNARIWELVRRNPVDNGFRKKALAVVVYQHTAS
jgi:hypothetical protein